MKDRDRVHWHDKGGKDEAACGHGYSLYNGRLPTTDNITEVTCQLCKSTHDSRTRVQVIELPKKPEDRFSIKPKVSRKDYPRF